LKVPNVQSLEWKPNKNILCVAAYKTQAAAKGEITGKIYLIEVIEIVFEGLMWKGPKQTNYQVEDNHLGVQLLWNQLGKLRKQGRFGLKEGRKEQEDL